jgi:nucleoid-associated protein YgaU
MSRYILANAQRDSFTEKRKLSTVIIPTPVKRTSDTFIQTVGTERLDKLALTFYGDATLWWVIASANALGKGSLMIPSGLNLRIPDKLNIQEYINQINQSR